MQASQLSSEDILENELAMEERLAHLLGWTNIVRLGGSLLGTPPEGEPSCRGQGQVPRWCRDWAAAGPLIAIYNVDLQHFEESAVGAFCEADDQWYSFEPSELTSKDHAVRYAVVLGAIMQLEKARKFANPLVVDTPAIDPAGED